LLKDTNLSQESAPEVQAVDPASLALSAILDGARAAEDPLLRFVLAMAGSARLASKTEPKRAHQSNLVYNIIHHPTKNVFSVG